VPKNNFRAEALLIMRPSFLKKSDQSGSKDGTMFSGAHIPLIATKRSLERATLFAIGNGSAGNTPDDTNFRADENKISRDSRGLTTLRL
jgi:hypothetical protein